MHLRNRAARFLWRSRDDKNTKWFDWLKTPPPRIHLSWMYALFPQFIKKEIFFTILIAKFCVPVNLFILNFNPEMSINNNNCIFDCPSYLCGNEWVCSFVRTWSPFIALRSHDNALHQNQRHCLRTHAQNEINDNMTARDPNTKWIVP